MLYLFLLTLTLFQTQESPHYEGWLIIQANAGDCPDAYENLGAMAWLTWEDQQANGYVYFDDGSIAKVEGDSLTFPSAVAAESEIYKLEWLKDGGGFKIKLIPEHQGKDPCAWKQAFLRLMKAKETGPSQQEWINEYQAMTIKAEVDRDPAQGTTTDAFTRLRQALALSPYNEELHKSVAGLIGQTDPGSLQKALMEEAKRATEAGQLDLAYAIKAPLALALNVAGDQALKKKDYEKALEIYKQALELIPTHHQALANAGSACSWLDRDGQALAFYQEAVTAATATGQFSAKARKFEAISRYHADILDLLMIMPDWAKAKTREVSALPSTPAIADAREQWERLNRLVLDYWRNGQYTKGLALALEALTLAEKHFGKNHPDYSASMNQLALLYQSKGAYDLAQPLFEQVLPLRRDVLGERHPETLSAMNNLAAFYESQGAYDRAQPLYEQALLLLRDVLGERHPLTLIAMNNLAFLYKSQGAYDRAQPLFELALLLCREVLGEHQPDTLLFINNLAHLYQSQGAYARAQPLYEQALLLRRDVLGERHPYTLNSMVNLAGIYQRQEAYDRAQPLYEQALLLQRDVLGERHPETLGTMNNLAASYQDLRNYDRAQPLYEQALLLYREVLGERHPNTLVSMHNLADLYKSQGAYDRAQPLQEQALLLCREVLGERHPHTLKSMSLLALLHLAIDDKEQGELLLHQYLAAANQFIAQIHAFPAPIRRSFIGQEDVFKHAYLSALIQSASEEAPLDLLSFSLQRKGLLFNLEGQEHSAQQAPEIDRLQRLRRELARRVSSSSAIAAQVEMQQIEARLGQNQHLETQIHPFQLFGAMPASSCLIDLHVFVNGDFKTLRGTDEVLALIIDPQARKAVRVVMLGTLEALEEDLALFLMSVSTHSKPSLREKSARALYQKLWSPLAPYVQGKETVYLSPDGILNRLPFGALVDEQGCGLAQTHKLHLLISPRDLLKTPTGNAGPAALVYAPDYEALPPEPDPNILPATERTFVPLIGARDEGRSLVAAYADLGEPVQELSDAAATEAAVAALKAPKVLHIASHAFYLNAKKLLGPSHIGNDRLGFQRDLIGDQAPPPSVDDWPYLNAAIALAGANQAARGITAADATDGLLTGLEVLSMNLRGTDLVVLSACETGLGDITPGEGAYSLNRAFLEAGARSVLSTLWRVDDSATAAFMTRFYERYLAGEPAVDALHAVQQEFIESEKWSDPYYWAPFVLVGGPKTSSNGHESQSSKLP